MCWGQLWARPLLEALRCSNARDGVWAPMGLTGRQAHPQIKPPPSGGQLHTKPRGGAEEPQGGGPLLAPHAPERVRGWTPQGGTDGPRDLV